MIRSPFFSLPQEDDDTEHIYGSVAELIGWTPLVECGRIAEKEGAMARIVVKLEAYQPGFNVKDRIALSMILDAEAKGILVPGVSTIVEPTSGNTGISLAILGILRGYKVVSVMPYLYSLERRMLLRALGSEVVLAEPDVGDVLSKCRELVTSLPNAVLLDQSQNPANTSAHYQSTGPEIWKDTAGKVEIFVSGCGTGGTLTGAGRYLKEQNPKVKVVGVEPVESPVLSGGKKGLHGIQGIGTGVIQPVTDLDIIDKVITVSTSEAHACCLRLIREEALMVGLSSGAAFAAALKLAKDPENKGKLIVTLLPSSAERYLSTTVFADIAKECSEMKPSAVSKPPSFWKEVDTEFQKHWEDGSSFPLVLLPSDDTQGRVQSLVTSIMLHQHHMTDMLKKHGAILFRGFNLNTADEFDRVVRAFGWREFSYKGLGGMASRTRVTGRVLTVNEEFPLDQHIAFHNEGAYLEEYPDKVFFFCERAPPPGTGGSTLIVGGSQVYKRLSEEYREYLDEFEQKGFKVSRCLDYETVAMQMDEAPARYAKVFQVTREDRSGRKAWFNAFGAAVSYSVPIVFGDESKVPEDAIATCLRVMEEEQVEFAWEKGDVLLLDNTAVLHARQACHSSSRTILVSLAK